MGDLSVTALYTAGTWAWAGLAGADLLDHRDSRRVFGATNAALAMARPFFGKAPSLRHSLVQRHVMIDRVLIEEGARHVLELAAGLSRRGLTFSADAGVNYVELDRAAVIAKKRELLARGEVGRAALARSNWRLLEGDVADAPLLDLAPGGKGEPLHVVVEGLFMYLDGPAQRALWTRLRRLFEGRSGALVFDLVPAIEQPKPGGAGRALGWLMSRFTGGAAFVRDARDRTAITQELMAAGFTVELMEPKDVAERWSLPFRDVRTQQLLWIARPA